MDMTSSQKRSLAEEPYKSDSEYGMKIWLKLKNSSPRVRISVEGFNPYRPKDELKSELINHFKSCGNVCRVILPRDPIFDRRAFVMLNAHGAREKALQLNGSYIGDWKALVKVAHEELEREYKAVLRYEDSLYDDLSNDKRFWYGIAVRGYDTSLAEDEIERALTKHFSCCGEITHVFVTLDEDVNIYFSKEEGEGRAKKLNGSEVGGFKINTWRLPTARRNTPHAHGGTCYGCGTPAPFLEFSDQIEEKVKTFKKEWRIKARRDKVRARKKQSFMARKMARILMARSERMSM